MKLDKKVLVVIRGPICAGKSTTAEALRRLIPDASRVDFDAFKVQLDNRGSSVWRRKTAERLALFMTKLVMQEGKPLIIDFPSNNMYLYQWYEQMAFERKYQFFSFLVEASLDICQQRNRLRAIPGAAYRLSPDMIEDFWKGTIPIEGEPRFRSEEMTPEEIARQIRNLLLEEKTHE